MNPDLIYDIDRANKAINNYNRELHQDRKDAGRVLSNKGTTKLRSMDDIQDNPKRAKLKEIAKKAVDKANQSRKYYHDSMDYNNTVPRDTKYLKNI